MPSTGLYFLPHSSTTAEDSPLRDFLARLTASYRVTPLQRWSLEHRLFRATPKATATPAAAAAAAAASASASASTDTDRLSPTSVKYLQVLSLSHEPGLSYIAITNTPNNNTTPAALPPSSSLSLPSSLPSSQKQQQQQQAARIGGADPSTADSNSSSSSSSIDNGAEAAATIASITSGQATDEFVQFLATKLAPLWTLLKMVSVANGLAYEVGDFRIRAGELRQGVGSSQVLRGIVVEINWVGGGGGGSGSGSGSGETEDSDRMEEEVQGVIKAFWEPLGISGAKEVFQVAGFAEGNGTVRQWVEMLRSRG